MSKVVREIKIRGHQNGTMDNPIGFICNLINDCECLFDTIIMCDDGVIKYQFTIPHTVGVDNAIYMAEQINREVTDCQFDGAIMDIVINDGTSKSVQTVHLAGNFDVGNYILHIFNEEEK